MEPFPDVKRPSFALALMFVFEWYTATGNVRPGIVKMGQPSKNLEQNQRA